MAAMDFTHESSCCSRRLALTGPGSKRAAQSRRNTSRPAIQLRGAPALTSPDEPNPVRLSVCSCHRHPASPPRPSHIQRLGYLVQGDVVTEVSGKPFEDDISPHMLEPLGMTRTVVTVTDAATWATPCQRLFSTRRVHAVRIASILRSRHGRWRGATALPCRRCRLCRPMCGSSGSESCMAVTFPAPCGGNVGSQRWPGRTMPVS